MSISLVDTVPARPTQGWDPAPLQGIGLKPGAVYAIGVETAAARVPLLLTPMRAALRAGRPCVLITRLNPEQAPFADALSDAMKWIDAAGAGGSGRLQVFTAVGDYDVNLLLHGAERYLQELDQFEIAPGSLLLIDEADDLYTSHDHGALVQQAKAYQAWCARQQHTMLQLHLRAGAHRPLLEGNQAAAHYLAGIGRVTSQPGGLQMAIDFWHSTAGTRTGLVVPLNRWLTSLASISGMNGVAAEPSAAAAREPAEPAAPLPPLWCVGALGADLQEWGRYFDVRVAPTLADVLAWPPGSQADRLGIAIALGAPDKLDDLVAQVGELRRAVGPQARIVVRESRYRLREYTQKRRLLRAGVDAVLTPAHTGLELVRLLLRPRAVPATEVADAAGRAGAPGVPEAPDSDATGWTSAPTFVDAVQRRVWRDCLSALPCALVEVEFEDASASGVATPVNTAPQSGRAGDLSTAAREARFFFLRGCRGSDSMRVVTRCLGDALAQHAQRIHVYVGEPAIGERLLRLRSEAGSDAPIADLSQNRPAVEDAPPPVASSSDALRRAASLAPAAALLVALTLPLADARAQVDAQVPAQASPVAVEVASLAYERGDYTEAARRGLIELRQAPGNHALRFIVANSLAWSGRYREALQQYGLLVDTAQARAAAVGAANVYVWSGRPHLADPLFRRVLEAEPGNVDAQEGLAAAQRQLRPRSTVRGESIDDSTQAERSGVMLAHRWRDAALTQQFEVSGERVDESRSPAGPQLRPRKFAFGYQHLAWPLAPRLVLAADTGVRSALYGNLTLHAPDDAVRVDIGRANWGEVVFDPRARADGLAAARVGVAGRVDASIGEISASAQHFAVTDGNRVAEASAQYTPAWQPIPAASGVRAFVAVYGRKAQRRDPRYWSPTGYYIGQLGVSLTRSTADWDLSAEVRRSQRIGGEGAQGWTAGLGGTRWLNRDWAVRFEGLYIETRRDASAYRSKSIAVSLDHLW